VAFPLLSISLTPDFLKLGKLAYECGFLAIEKPDFNDLTIPTHPKGYHFPFPIAVTINTLPYRE
jgi:hypothetical protein